MENIQCTLRTVVPILYLGVGKLGGGGAVNVFSSPSSDVVIMAGVMVTKWLGTEEHVCSVTILSFLECVTRFGSFPFEVEVTAAAASAAAAATPSSSSSVPQQ
jgi:hypothetical protein